MTPLILIASAVAVACMVFLTLRRVVWWYFGIGEQHRLLRSIDASLQQLPAVREARTRQAAARKRVAR